jgi:GNAT superfamily N-acetyltransferase
MLDMPAIARMESARMAQGSAEIAAECITLPGGGRMLRDAPGTWCNFACDLGFDGPVSTQTIQAIEDYYTSHRLEPRVELFSYAHESLLHALAARGWVLRGVEHVFVRELTPDEGFTTPTPPPDGLDIEVVARTDAHTLRVYAHTVCAGFAIGQTPPSEADLALAIRIASHPRTFGLLARINGQPAAGGACEVTTTAWGTSAGLFGMATLPRFRQRGIQQALLAARLRLAQQRGATVATIGGKPGAGTERNVRRMGFTLGFAVLIAVKPGDGLVPVTS